MKKSVPPKSVFTVLLKLSKYAMSVRDLYQIEAFLRNRHQRVVLRNSIFECKYPILCEQKEVL